jgi:multimeric flavodoxin WrbA
MSKKIFVLSASPRKGGNSDLLCDQFTSGANEAGHHAEKIFLKDKKSITAQVVVLALMERRVAPRKTTWPKFWRK